MHRVRNELSGASLLSPSPLITNNSNLFSPRHTSLVNQGNHYCSRDYGSSAANANSYHYSNSNGSYYYSNPNGSTYYNNGSGSAIYTSPSGRTYYKQG